MAVVQEAIPFGLQMNVAFKMLSDRYFPKSCVRKTRAKEACASVQFHCADIFKNPASLRDAFDFLIDVQTFHAIYHLDAASLVRSMASLLRNRGLALVVTGNSVNLRDAMVWAEYPPRKILLHTFVRSYFGWLK